MGRARARNPRPGPDRDLPRPADRAGPGRRPGQGSGAGRVIWAHSLSGPRVMVVGLRPQDRAIRRRRLTAGRRLRGHRLNTRAPMPARRRCPRAAQSGQSRCERRLPVAALPAELVPFRRGPAACRRQRSPGSATRRSGTPAIADADGYYRVDDLGTYDELVQTMGWFIPSTGASIGSIRSTSTGWAEAALRTTSTWTESAPTPSR